MDFNESKSDMTPKSIKSAMIAPRDRSRESSKEREKPYTSTTASQQQPHSMSVADFVSLSTNNLRLRKNMLNYHPSQRMYQQKVLKWDILPKKTCYLDDVMKVEKKKISP